MKDEGLIAKMFEAIVYKKLKHKGSNITPIYELNNLIHTHNRQDCIEFYSAEYKCEIERNGAFEVHYTTIRIRLELVKNILLKGTIEELYNNYNVR